MAIDIQKGYDNVNRRQLFLFLDQSSLSDFEKQIVNLIKSLYIEFFVGDKCLCPN